MQLYVCDDEFEGAYVGTLEEITEWMSENVIPVSRATFYKIGEQVTIKLAEEENK